MQKIVKILKCQWIFINGKKTKYMVFSNGKVINSKSNKKLKTAKDKYGYGYINLNHKGKKYHKLIHRLVAIAFIPNPKNKEHVNHIDGDKLNNNMSNLEWNTPLENIHHAIKNNLRHQKAYIENNNIENVTKICELLQCGHKIRGIVKKLKVTKHLVMDIKRRRTYKYISKDYVW